MTTLSSSLSRRDFIVSGAIAASASALGVAPVRAKTPSARFPIIIFTLPFQKFSAEETAEFITECGYDGIECPVRSHGQVEPEKVADDLPPYVESLRKRGRDFTMAATDITRIDQPHAETVLRTLSKLGVKRFRLGFQSYDLAKPLMGQVREIAAALKDLAAACQQLGLQAGLQNHSGTSQVGAPVWDVFSMIRDIDPRYLGLCFDIAHATVEGGLSWPLQARLTEPFVTAGLVKDFVWKKKAGAWAPDWCPLGEGMVSREYFARLKTTTFRGPISQQFFHELGDRRQMTNAIRKDLSFLKGWLE